MCIDIFSQLKQDVHSCLFCAMTSKDEEMIVHVPLELRRYSNLSRHVKEPQKGFVVLIYLKK